MEQIMSNIPKYHHLIPRTYIKSWKHGLNSVYIIKKDKSVNPEEKNIDSLGGINYYHSIVAGMINASPEECDIIFSPLKDFEIEYEGERVTTPYHLNHIFYDYVNWILYYPNGRSLGRKKKNELKQNIKRNIISDIEKKWAMDYEDNWKKTVSKLPYQLYTGSRPFVSQEINRKEFVDFIVSLDWRNKNSNDKFTETVNRYTSNLFDYQIIPRKERTLPFMEKILDEIKHGLLLNTFKGFQSGKGFMNLQAEKILNKGSLHFFLAGDKTEFITSDKPVQYGYIGDKITIHFPINPKLMCTIAKNECPKKFYFEQLSNSHTKKLNKLLKENCNDFYILRETNLDKYF